MVKKNIKIKRRNLSYWNQKGNLFHIDFGFILGRDPKPFPPPFKLCQEMVQGMGTFFKKKLFFTYSYYFLKEDHIAQIGQNLNNFVVKLIIFWENQQT